MVRRFKPNTLYRYKVERKVTGNPKIILVESEFNNEKYVLKYLPERDFLNSIEIYRKLKNCVHVCKYKDEKDPSWYFVDCLVK